MINKNRITDSAYFMMSVESKVGEEKGEKMLALITDPHIEKKFLLTQQKLFEAERLLALASTLIKFHSQELPKKIFLAISNSLISH